MGMQGFGDFGDAFGGFSQFSAGNDGPTTNKADKIQEPTFSQGLKAIDQEFEVENEYAGFEELPFEDCALERPQESYNIKSEINSVKMPPFHEAQHQEPLPLTLSGRSPDQRPPTVERQERSKRSEKLDIASSGSRQYKQEKETPHHHSLAEVTVAIENVIAGQLSTILTGPDYTKPSPRESIKPEQLDNRKTPSVMTAPLESKAYSGLSLLQAPSLTLPQAPPRTIVGISVPVMKTPALMISVMPSSPKKDKEPPLTLNPINRAAVKTPLISFPMMPSLKPLELANPSMNKTDSTTSVPKLAQLTVPIVKEVEPKRPPEPSLTIAQLAKPQLKLGGVNLKNQTPGVNFSFGNLGFTCKLEEQKKQVKLNTEVSLKLPQPSTGPSIGGFPSLDNLKTLSFGDKAESIKPPLLSLGPMLGQPPKEATKSIPLVVPSMNIKPPEPALSLRFGKTNTATSSFGGPKLDKPAQNEARPHPPSYQIFNAPTVDEVNRSFKEMKAETVKVQENVVKCTYLVKRIASLRSYIAFKFRETDREVSNLGIRL